MHIFHEWCNWKQQADSDDNAIQFKVCTICNKYKVKGL